MYFKKKVVRRTLKNTGLQRSGAATAPRAEMEPPVKMLRSPELHGDLILPDSVGEVGNTSVNGKEATGNLLGICPWGCWGKLSARSVTLEAAHYCTD